MAYLLTNASALTALEALTKTQQALTKTQTEISTGMSVSQASDNPAYWSIATEMTSNNGVLSAVQTSLSQSSAMIDVATAAVNTVISTINSIKTELSSADNPGVPNSSIRSRPHVTQLGQELRQAVTGASYNGTNLLDGSTAATLNFISGYQQSAAGVPTVDTINVDHRAALYRRRNHVEHGGRGRYNHRGRRDYCHPGPYRQYGDGSTTPTYGAGPDRQRHDQSRMRSR